MPNRDPISPPPHHSSPRRSVQRFGAAFGCMVVRRNFAFRLERPRRAFEVSAKFCRTPGRARHFHQSHRRLRPGAATASHAPPALRPAWLSPRRKQSETFLQRRPHSCAQGWRARTRAGARRSTDVSRTRHAIFSEENEEGPAPKPHRDRCTAQRRAHARCALRRPARAARHVLSAERSPHQKFFAASPTTLRAPARMLWTAAGRRRSILAL